MLWTVIPIELVMADEGAAPKQTERRMPDGSTVMVDSSTGVDRILRLHSTDPSHYLNPEYSPGGPAPLVQATQSMKKPNV
jgi:hypothetical protein